MPVYTFVGKPSGSIELHDTEDLYVWNEDIVWDIGRAMKMKNIVLLSARIQFTGIAYYQSVRIQPKFITERPQCTTFYTGMSNDLERFGQTDNVDRNSIVRLVDSDDMLFNPIGSSEEPEDHLAMYEIVSSPLPLGNANQCANGKIVMSFSFTAAEDDDDIYIPLLPSRVEFTLEIE